VIIYGVLCMRLKIKPYKLQLLQNLMTNDKSLKHNSHLNKGNLFLNKTVFSNEAAFHVSSWVNHHHSIFASGDSLKIHMFHSCTIFIAGL
jgi:hypothetical protein